MPSMRYDNTTHLQAGFAAYHLVSAGRLTQDGETPTLTMIHKVVSLLRLKYCLLSYQVPGLVYWFKKWPHLSTVLTSIIWKCFCYKKQENRLPTKHQHLRCKKTVTAEIKKIKNITCFIIWRKKHCRIRGNKGKARGFI